MLPFTPESSVPLLGLTGLGGYAGNICRLLLTMGSTKSPAVRLAAVCEPNLAAHGPFVEELRTQGIVVTDSYEHLLDQPIAAVWLPLPVALHRDFTVRALAAGKAVLCEKPAAGCVQDLEAMRAARDRVLLPVALGFQDIYEPSTRELKLALRAGEIGAVRSATLTACWPRDSHYYTRNAWAGRQGHAGAWVIDSPASNALAHFVNLALFLMGESDDESAVLASVEAELYRANPIENYDTCGLRITTDCGAPLLVLLTHACREERAPCIVLHGQNGTLTYTMNQEARVETTAGSVRTIPLRDVSRTQMVQRFTSLLQGRNDDPRFVASLEIGRTHLVAVNGASEASPVQTVPDAFVSTIVHANGGIVRAITGVEALFDTCAREQKLPHELASAPRWTAPAGRRDLRGYNYFSGPALEGA